MWIRDMGWGDPLSTATALAGWEIAESRLVQQALLPTGKLRTESADVTFLFRPASEVGGDFIDYFQLPNGHLVCYIGDVVGKGLPAALYAALVMGVLRGLNKTGEPPGGLLATLNARLLERIVPERFCMLQYAVFDPASRTLAFANAGMNLPLHISSSRCRELGEGGFPCGLLEEASYDTHSVTLLPGEAVLFATDGLVEAQNSKGEPFRVDRLMEACARNMGEPGDVLLGRAFETVDLFAGSSGLKDDMTACLISVH
jgi:sigma-B regulation protein RsbU (phosphoserine phosphatase)